MEIYLQLEDDLQISVTELYCNCMTLQITENKEKIRIQKHTSHQH